MNKKEIVFSVASVLIIAGLLAFGMMREQREKQVEQSEAGTQQVEQKVFTFYDQKTGESTSATFGDRSVTFTNEKFGTMTLPQTISASGARYANTDETIVFWNKGDSIFITKGGVIVFNGSLGEPGVSKPQ